MKAIVQDKYGSPEDLHVQEVDPPSVDDDEVLVRVRAASVHPDVWHTVTGRPYALRVMGGGVLRPKHRIPGTDMAGIVESVGSTVTRFRTGDPVFGETMASHQWTNGGAYAELVSVREEWLAHVPDNVTLEQAASVPTSGFITMLNLRDTSLAGPGKRVLVNGAGGGVGSIALQVAKSYGAHVTAVDATRKLDMLRSLGADEVIDYTLEDFTESSVPYDLIFDVPGNRPFAACRRVLTPDGRYMLIGHEGFGRSRHTLLGLLPKFFGFMFIARFNKHLKRQQTPMPTRSESLEALRRLLEDGTITPIIDSSFPMNRIADAFRHLIEGEPLGKVLITISR